MPKHRAEAGAGIDWALLFIGHMFVIGQGSMKFNLQKLRSVVLFSS